MHTFLINASAAKNGGAETIIRTFVSEIPKDSNRYIVLSPLKFETKNYSNNITFVYKATSGVGTILFTVIGIILYVIRYRPRKILSFNNINYMFSQHRGVTYFHQLKALKGHYSDKKIMVYDFIINYFLKNNTFVVQSELIKKLFKKKYACKKIVTSWPGFNIPNIIDIENSVINKNEYSKIGLLPIAYVASHKNIESVNALISFFKKHSIGLITLLDNSNLLLKDPDVFINIGSVNRNKLFSLYTDCDFIIFPSLDETVGLPIFEFMQTGKPAFVFNAEYAYSYYEQFKRPENFILYSNIDDFTEKFKKNIDNFDKSINYSQGEWDKIFKLLL